MEVEATRRSSKVEAGIVAEGTIIFLVADALEIAESLVLAFEGIVGIVGIRTIVDAVALDAV